ncbi:MAG: hypothetical protein ACO2ZM_08775 [Francisellaceae bacterium]
MKKLSPLHLMVLIMLSMLMLPLVAVAAIGFIAYAWLMQKRLKPVTVKHFHQAPGNRSNGQSGRGRTIDHEA